MGRSKSSRRRGGTSTPSSSVSPKNLHMDLITAILSRLPVKSLTRFKSVSKLWYSLIQSSYFIKLHFNFSKLNPHPIFSSILTVHNNLTSTNGYVFRLNLIDSLDKPIDIDFPSMPGRLCRVLGVSNGLICSMLGGEHSSDIIVSNPVTGNFRKLPPFETSSLYRDCSFYGFSSSETGFELITIKCQSNSVKVSSFSSSANVWKDVKVKMGKHVISTDPILYLKLFYGNQVPVFKNGVFYWEGYQGGRARVVILDLFNKEFDVIPPPDDYHDQELGFIEFKEQIMVVNGLDLWMLNEKDKTWRLFKRIDVFDGIPGDGLLSVLGCTGMGKLVLRHQYDSNSVLNFYDIDTGDTNILTYVSVKRGFATYLFAESLAAVQTV